ncbi:FAD-dependent oxidoreductase [Candidatus Omnitrophota bacterium]
MKRALVIGGGFAGCTAAHMLKQKGFDITLIEASDSLGGGCRTFFYHGHPFTYGPHHLLVNVEEMYVWDYLSKFLSLREIKHYTITYSSPDNRFYTYPIHKDEIEEMPDKDIIQQELKKRKDVKKAKNFEEYWIRSVGKTLYDKFIHTYSEKMWKIKDNKEIDEFTFSPKGVALKTGSKQCFEGQKVIGYPVELDAYNSYFENCVEGCNVIYNTFVDKLDLSKKRVYVQGKWLSADLIISTASIDMVFEYMYGELKYIGRDFLKVILPIEQVTPEPYQYLHYAGDEPYTRIFEYKLLTGYKSKDTLLIIETPSFNNRLYPYPLKSEIEKAQKYLAALPEDVYSLGRMGKYHYDNIDIIIKDCMKLMKEI